MRDNLSLSSHQIKAARALLDWSQDDLAENTTLSVATIRKLELGYISPRHSTTSVVRQSFESAGLEFIEPDGVRRSREDIVVYEGVGGTSDFLEDICRTVKSKSGEVVVVEGADSALFSWENIDMRFKQYEQIIRATENTRVKCLLTGPCDIPFLSPHLEVRSISKNFVDPLPLCVYADKYAMIVPGAGPYSRIIAVRSVAAARAALRQFYSMWEMASPFYAKVAEKNIERIARRRDSEETTNHLIVCNS